MCFNHPCVYVHNIWVVEWLDEYRVLWYQRELKITACVNDLLSYRKQKYDVTNEKNVSSSVSCALCSSVALVLKTRICMDTLGAVYFAFVSTKNVYEFSSFLFFFASIFLVISSLFFFVYFFLFCVFLLLLFSLSFSVISSFHLFCSSLLVSFILFLSDFLFPCFTLLVFLFRSLQPRAVASAGFRSAGLRGHFSYVWTVRT
jgi:hypothetical protein